MPLIPSGIRRRLRVVADAGWTVRRRRVGRERYFARNQEIRLRHHRGESYAKLGLAYGLSRFRIGAIVRAGRRVCSLKKRTRLASGLALLAAR